MPLLSHTGKQVTYIGGGQAHLLEMRLVSVSQLMLGRGDK